MTDLYPYQRTGAEFLAARKAALLADDMGLGKCAQAITALRETNSGAFLVVCPASVVETWKHEIARWWPGCDALWNVISYDHLVRTGKRDWHDAVEDLVLDEAHYLKTPTAKRTKALFGEKCDGKGGLVERARHVWLLTGTPMPNNPSEMWPALRALAPQAITSERTGRVRNFWQFVNRYCTTRDNGFGIQITGGRNHADLKAKLDGFMLRRTKAEVLDDLPEIRFEQLFVEGKVECSPEVGFDDHAEIVANILRTKGVAGLREIATHVASLRRLTGLAKVASTVEWVQDWLASGDGKIVLFAHHREVIDQLSRSLANAVVVTGSTSQPVRAAAIDSFQNDDEIRVFIGQITAAGTGITLTAASDLLFVEGSWVPAENSQAAMRIHRIGQKDACLVRFATLAGSIDEQIQRAVARKTADITKIFG